MDSYDEAMADFDAAYVDEPTYDMAIQIYQAYVERDMEADGTRYLEAALETEPENAEELLQPGPGLLLYAGLFQCSKGTDRGSKQ